MGLDYTCCVVLLPYGEAATLPKMANTYSQKGNFGSKSLCCLWVARKAIVFILGCA